MIRKTACCCGLIAVVLASANPSRAAGPDITGAISGIELCEQSVCGAAIFVGVFYGTVDG
ncbi:MAG: hypothetical protein CMJ48_02945 [Planctomycetaceae bacterium]|nr:hypothetical protein [Planctomycetaceae bacterium]